MSNKLVGSSICQLSGKVVDDNGCRGCKFNQGYDFNYGNPTRQCNYEESVIKNKTQEFPFIQEIIRLNNRVEYLEDKFKKMISMNIELMEKGKI